MTRRTTIALALALVAVPAAARSDVPKGIETFDRAWTIVRDTHFDPTFNGVDWEAVRTELRPRAEAAKTTAELRTVIGAMLGASRAVAFRADPLLRRAGGRWRRWNRKWCRGSWIRYSSGRRRHRRDRYRQGPRRGSGWREGRLAADGGRRQERDRSAARAASDRERSASWFAGLAAAAGAAAGECMGPASSSRSKTGAVRRSSARVERQAELGQPVTVGSLPTMHVRVSDEEHTTPGGRKAAVIGFNVWMAAVDAPFQKAVDRHPFGRRHHHRSSRQSRGPGRDDDGHFRSFRARAAAAGHHENARPPSFASWPIPARWTAPAVPYRSTRGRSRFSSTG